MQQNDKSNYSIIIDTKICDRICGAFFIGTWLDEQIFTDINATFTLCTLPTIPELYALNGSHVKLFREKCGYVSDDIIDTHVHRC